MKTYALLTHPEHGHDHDKQTVKALEEGKYYEIKRISMGGFHTSIYLKDIKGVFNSVNFTFYDENKQLIDIYKMPEFNGYIPKEVTP